MSGNGIDLSYLQGQRRAALLIRHSERAGGAIATDDEQLTDQGRRMALDLGRSLRHFGPIRLFSSPVGRCQETARLIGRGAGCEETVKLSTNLGKPGTFIVDELSVVSRMNRIGFDPFISLWHRGELPSSEVRSFADGSRALIDWTVGELSSMPSGLDVHVSHDLDLTPVLVEYLDYDLAKGLLGYLDGFIVVAQNGKGRIRYRGREAEI